MNESRLFLFLFKPDIGEFRQLYVPALGTWDNLSVCGSPVPEYSRRKVQEAQELIPGLITADESLYIDTPGKAALQKRQ